VKVIAFSGNIGSGKSLFARSLTNSIEYSYVKLMSFAEPLKRAIAYKDIGYDRAKKTNILPGVTGRDVMHCVARCCQQRYGDDYFANILVEEAKAVNPDYLIIDDLRFEIEYKVLKKEFDDVFVVGIRDEKPFEYEIENIPKDLIINNIGHKADIDEVIKKIMEENEMVKTYMFDNSSQLPNDEKTQDLFSVWKIAQMLYDIDNIEIKTSFGKVKELATYRNNGDRVVFSKNNTEKILAYGIKN